MADHTPDSIENGYIDFFPQVREGEAGFDELDDLGVDSTDVIRAITGYEPVSGDVESLQAQDDPEEAEPSEEEVRFDAEYARWEADRLKWEKEVDDLVDKGFSYDIAREKVGPEPKPPTPMAMGRTAIVPTDVRAS